MAFGNKSGNNGGGFDLLNLKKHKISTKISGTITVYGNPKTGKTSFLTKLYDEEHSEDGREPLLLAYEFGYNFLNVSAIDMLKYDDINKVIRELKKPEVKERFNVIIIDTIDIYSKMTEKYVCDNARVDSLSDKPFGALYKTFDEAIEKPLLEIQRLGYSLAFISHASLKTDFNDDQKTTITMTCMKRAANIFAKMSDHILYLDMDYDESTDSYKRWINCRETELFQAGSRLKGLPSRIPLDVDIFEEEVKKAVLNAGDTTDEEGVIAPIYKEIDFEELKADVINLVKTVYMPTDNMHIVTEVTEEIFGVDSKINDLVASQREGLQTVYDVLLDKSKGLE